MIVEHPMHQTIEEEEQLLGGRRAGSEREGEGVSE